MARPTKQGVDYFPMDVHLDDKFKFIEIKFKLEGFAIVVKLMQKIYSYGYWYKWTEDELLLFADEVRVDYDLVDRIVKECLIREIFDQTLYDKYSILTSRGIQKRYKEIVRRRKDVNVITEYLLIDDIAPTLTRVNDGNNSTYPVNDDNNGVNDGNNPASSEHGDGESTQSKVKESKVKESKASAQADAAAFNPFQLFEHEGFGTIGPTVADTLNVLIDDYGETRVCGAMREAVQYGARNLKYVATILNNPNSVKGKKKDDIDWDKIS